MNVGQIRFVLRLMKGGVDWRRDRGLGDDEESGQRLGSVGNDDGHAIGRVNATRAEARGAFGDEARHFRVGRKGTVRGDQSDRVRSQACCGLDAVEDFCVGEHRISRRQIDRR